MDKQKKDLISAWYKKAEHDLKTVSIILNANDDNKPFDNVCFHCQQAAEKFLKAYLIHLSVSFPRTHNIGQLIFLCLRLDKKIEELMYTDELSPYGVDIRYPDDFFMPTEEDAWKAFQYAKDLKDYISERLFP